MKFETGKSGSIITFRGSTPKLHPSVFLAEGVKIIGDVKIGKDCSVWYNTVIRADVHYIRIGERTNIQDLCMLHVTHDTRPLNIGDNVTTGHSVTLHGCTIHDNNLIGIGARVLDGAIVRPFSLIAAGAVVKENFEVPEGSLAAGVPAKVIRKLTDEEKANIPKYASNYVNYVKEYREELRANSG